MECLKQEQLLTISLFLSHISFPSHDHIFFKAMYKVRNSYFVNTHLHDFKSYMVWLYDAISGVSFGRVQKNVKRGQMLFNKRQKDVF